MIEVKRTGGANGSCSFLELRKDSGSEYHSATQTVTVSIDVDEESKWLVLTFTANVVAANPENVSIQLQVSGVGDDVGQLEAATDPEHPFETNFEFAVEVTEAITDANVTVKFEVCPRESGDVIFQVDNVSLRVCDTGNPSDLVFDTCIIGGPFAGIETPSKCTCIPDIAPEDDPDGVVGMADLLQVLRDWGDDVTCVLGDINTSGDVDFTDLNLVIGNWDPCPDSSEPEPDSLEDVVECMGISEEAWDDFEYEMEHGTDMSAQLNYACWVEHYYIFHCGIPPCFCPPGCPDDDPFSSSNHYPY